MVQFEVGRFWFSLRLVFLHLCCATFALGLELMFWILAASGCRCAFDFDYFGLISARAYFGFVVG